MINEIKPDNLFNRYGHNEDPDPLPNVALILILIDGKQLEAKMSTKLLGSPFYTEDGRRIHVSEVLGWKYSDYESRTSDIGVGYHFELPIRTLPYVIIEEEE